MNNYFIQYGPAAVVAIAIVGIFLKFLKSDRQAFLDVISNHISENTIASEKLANAIDNLLDFLRENSRK